MGLIKECGMLVDELRNDPAFVDALTRLRDAISGMVDRRQTRGMAAKCESVTERLVDVIERLEAQR